MVKKTAPPRSQATIKGIFIPGIGQKRKEASGETIKSPKNWSIFVCQSESFVKTFACEI
jgi:hypothetical protein